VASSSVRVGFENGDTIDIALTLKALNILAAMLWLVSAGLLGIGRDGGDTRYDIDETVC
jgi:hypothetical protein